MITGHAGRQLSCLLIVFPEVDRRAGNGS